MPRLMSFAKTVAAFQDGTKDVTRRDGWKSLKPGDIIEAVEWSPRVGERWVCACGWQGSTKRSRRHALDHRCAQGCPVYRGPRKLGQRRVVRVRRERLGDITAEDVAREGFPGESPEWFIARYCSPGKADPERFITRIELASLSPEEVAP